MQDMFYDYKLSDTIVCKSYRMITMTLKIV